MLSAVGTKNVFRGSDVPRFGNVEVGSREMSGKFI